MSIPVYSEELPLKSNLHAPQISEPWNEVMFFINLSWQYKVKQNIALQILRMVGLFFFPKDLFIYFYVCVCVLSACMCVYHVLALCPESPEEGTEAFGTGLPDSCEPT